MCNQWPKVKWSACYATPTIAKHMEITVLLTEYAPPFRAWLSLLLEGGCWYPLLI
jgi:hypothetical protein